MSKCDLMGHHLATCHSGAGGKDGRSCQATWSSSRSLGEGKERAGSSLGGGKKKV